MSDFQHPLPLAPDHEAWSYIEKSSLGIHGACDLAYRVKVKVAKPKLPPVQAHALPLLLHEFDRQHGLYGLLHAASLGQGGKSNGTDRVDSPKAILTRILPRLLAYRYIESKQQREFVFAGYRPSSLHVLSRVLETDFRFRLEDLSHFATHGEFLLRVLRAVGLKGVLDPDAILYCPALDSPFPFKFAVVGTTGIDNRDVYVGLLKRLLRKTEDDEVFRARTFRELTRGFQKFGPASATPQFQEVELRIWKLASYLAARLRVKAGRLTDARDPSEIRQFLAELREVHSALDGLVHLPSRLAAFYRSRFDLEFGGLYEHALPLLDDIAKKIDCDLTERERSIDAVAALVEGFRRLGSASPLESLEEKDREIKLNYGDMDVPPVKGGWARTYTAKIFTGAQRFDTRRYSHSAVEMEEIGEEDWDFEFEMGDEGGEAPGEEEELEGDLDNSAYSEDTRSSSSSSYYVDAEDLGSHLDALSEEDLEFDFD